MIRIVDGKPVQVPDDERITPVMKEARTQINNCLAWLHENGPEVQAIDKAYREALLDGGLLNNGQVGGSLEWYTDAEK